MSLCHRPRPFRFLPSCCPLDFLLDLNLPGRNGFEVLKWLRLQSELKSLPVVVVSGSNQARDMEVAEALGITDYIVKPSGVDRLLQVVRKKVLPLLPK